MNSQQRADLLLAQYQADRRTRGGDIGNMTFGLWANAKDIYDTWMEQPLRRWEFGDRELFDIEEALLALQTLRMEINKRKAA